MIDLVVRPYCNTCAKSPTAECWERCNRAARTANELEQPAVYCMQCASGKIERTLEHLVDRKRSIYRNFMTEADTNFPAKTV